jgi:hypothetical protein
MWVRRVARFNVGLGGIQIVGYSIPSFGSNYELTDSIADAVPAMYDALRGPAWLRASDADRLLLI